MTVRRLGAQGRRSGRNTRIRLGAVALLFAATMVATACGGTEQTAAPAAKASPAPASPVASAAAGTATALATATAVPNYITLKTSPERGPGGTKFTLTGDGLPASTKLDFTWGTQDGSYQTNFNNNSIEYVDRSFKPVTQPLGQATTDASGKLSITFTAPQDFGNTHDILALNAGKAIAKGGFFTEKVVQFSPASGPIGTPITVSVTGMGWKAFESTAALMYDNRYVGFVSGTTTHGTAKFTVRASGAAGPHYIEFYCASAALPYTNCEQSPVGFLGTQRFTFNVTGDNGAPANTMEWADGAAIAANPPARTTVATQQLPAGVTASLSSPTGPIHSKTTVQAKGLAAAAKVSINWTNVVGSRVQGGWDLGETPLAQATVSADGTISTDVEIPDTLGGWHAIRLHVGDAAVAETPYFVQRSLAKLPQTVKAGDTFTLQAKGIGWTELDNAFAIVYDNAYMGYACGFSTNGDVTMDILATGGPGTHLIDLYPMIYDNGHGKFPWQYNIPQLSFNTDDPGLALGYNLPVLHLAITVTQ